MMNNLKTLLVLIVVTFISMSELILPQNEMQGVKVTDAGTFSGNLNGKEFQTAIRYSEAKDLVSMATGDEGFTLTLNFERISSIGGIKTGAHKLPGDEGITVIFLDNSLGMPSVIKNGNFTVTENDGKVVKGTLEFTALAGGIPKEMGGTEAKLSGGNFVINKKE
jgi:hypothetical protein